MMSYETFKICSKYYKCQLKMSEDAWLFKILLREREQQGLKTSALGIDPHLSLEGRCESLVPHGADICKWLCDPWEAHFFS